MRPTPRGLTRCLLVVGVLLYSVVSHAALPDRPAPAGFASVDGAMGGRTLAGTFTGDARSAAVVLGGMLRALRAYFDGAPVVSGAVGDPGDRGIMAFFDARLQGARRSGA
jgi:hypothetical protein